jgi:hypothetical protein
MSGLSCGNRTRLHEVVQWASTHASQMQSTLSRKQDTTYIMFGIISCTQPASLPPTAVAHTFPIQSIHTCMYLTKRTT